MTVSLLNLPDTLSNQDIDDSPGSPYNTDGIMFDFLLSHTVRRVQNANHMENSCYNVYVVSLLNHLEQNILKTLRKKNTQSINVIAF